MKWEKVENDRGKQGAFRDILLVHRKKNCEFTFHRQRDGKKKGGKGSVKKGSRLMNFAKRTSKRENTIENHALPPVHVQWKEENQYKNGRLFSAWERRGKRSTLYIFSQFHSLPVEAVRYPLSADRYRLSRLAAGCIPKRRVHQTPLHQTPLLLMYNNIAPAGRHYHPLNLLNPVNPHVRILHRMRKSAEVGP
ncbi:hypothetical protein [uncultured Dialister sp.]|uniref:hypothetical protein n=1 Tax=Dialister succinatiphilus TaxID=487173 RepID=UPI00266FB8A2|nr:hypothetical protein [uncultured Dialister sp.]